MSHARVLPAADRLWCALAARPRTVALLLLVVTLVGYGTSLGGSFLWDDTWLVERNLFMRAPRLVGEGFRHFLESAGGSSRFYRPVQTLSYAVDYACWASRPFGYRLTNVLLHTAVAFLIYLLGRRLLPALPVTAREAAPSTGAAEGASLSMALLWVVHPVHSAAVAYVSGRADSLAMGFSLLAWWLYERTVSGPVARRGFFYGLALLAWLAALLSKEMAAVWLIFFAARLFFLPTPSRRPASSRRRRQLVTLGAALVPLAAALALRQLPPPAPPPPGAALPARAPARPELMVRALGDYTRLLLFPTDLHMERQVFGAYDDAISSADPDKPYRWLRWAGLGSLVLLTAGALWHGRGQGWRVAGAGWFLAGFLPVSNLFPLNATVAEHWLYVPSVGFILFVVGLWAGAPGRWRSALATGGLALALPLLLGRTIWRSADWRDELTFARQTVAAGGGSERLRAMLGIALLKRGDLAEAERVQCALLADHPNSASARLPLAAMLLQGGRIAEGEEALLAAFHHVRTQDGPRPLLQISALLERIPEPPEPAARAQRASDLAQVAAALETAWRREPDRWDLVENQARRLARQGGPSAGAALVDAFVRDHPWHRPALLMLGDLWAAAGGRDGGDRALDAWERARRLDLHDREAGPRIRALQSRMSQPADPPSSP